MPRSLGVVVVAAFVVGLLVMFFVFLLPPLTTQMTHLAQELPDLRARVSSGSRPSIPPSRPGPRAVRVVFLVQAGRHAGAIVRLGAERRLGRGDGRDRPGRDAVPAARRQSLYAWLLAFVPRTHREKLATTMDEVSDVVHAYVGGQLLAAVLFAVFTAALLTILGVPAAVPLAVIAGVCDIIPVLGILLAIVPAVLLALVVSPGTAAVVLVAYLAYHLFETYYLLPRIYGSKLRISTLSVLLALIVGGRLQGIIGAVLVLPVVAAYPSSSATGWAGT